MNTTRRTWIEIDTSVFLHNIELLKSKLKPGVKFAAVVKANAYGHGIVKISKLLSKVDAAFLAVTYLEEAIELRENNISIPVLMLSQPFVEDISVVGY
ncbi:MAG: alanine racemase [Candidatus Levybacteria bacterium]|nr:alanine racemase [Candidatus Levybacteria bacterium]